MGRNDFNRLIYLKGLGQFAVFGIIFQIQQEIVKSGLHVFCGIRDFEFLSKNYRLPVHFFCKRFQGH